jgi:IS605 OrfB family transposase
MIRSTKVSVKFTNVGKLETYYEFLSEYKRVVLAYIDLLWYLEKVPKFIGNDYQVDTWLSARAKQAAGKQASGIVRGTRRKQEKRMFVIHQLLNQNQVKKAKKLQAIYDKNNCSKPAPADIQAELDSRFVKVDLDNTTTFDGWLTLSSLGHKIKLHLPFKKTKHFNKLASKGIITSGARLSKKQITFMFDVPEPPKKDVGEVLGIDVGMVTTFSCSDGFVSKKNMDGYDLSSITDVLIRRKPGSNGYKQAQQHRTNYINWSVNQLNLDAYKQVNIEDIKHLRKNKRSSKKLNHWVYTDIFSKVESYCLERGVLVKKVSPTYTSKRCHKCGWTCNNNRKGKQLKCVKCGYVADADLNAASNIAMSLTPIYYGSKKQQRLNSKTGFYWLVEGEESIVPHVLRTD